MRQTTVAASALSLPMVASSSVLGANDEIRIGAIGLGIRGAGVHMWAFQSQPGVRVTAICDPDHQRLDAAAKGAYTRVEKYTDPRKLLESSNIDAVSVATMQYWHALPTIWACQAGKHVYCEKPLSHFIWEGRKMVEAARKYDRLVQVGMQSRSYTRARAAIDYARSGKLGKITHIVTFANKPRWPIGNRKEPLPIPDSVDYELWCGPARKEPIYRDRLQYDCSFTWNMGDGESCNQGVHEIDVARWILGENKLPRRTISLGGRFCYNDVGDVPNTQIIYYDFPTAPVLYEVHNLRKAKASKESIKYNGSHVDICVYCEGGHIMIRQGAVFDTKGKKILTLPGNDSQQDHFNNFIAAVRSGRREDLNADVELGHISTAITHAGNISYRLGQKASPAAIRKSIAQAPLFGDMYDRLRDHLKANEVDVDAETVTLGPWIEWDGEKELAKNNDKANELVKGFEREPWKIGEV